MIDAWIDFFVTGISTYLLRVRYLWNLPDPPYTYAYPYANAFAYAYAHADADAYAYACASTYAYDYAYAWLCSLIVREHNSAQCLFLETLPQK